MINMDTSHTLVTFLGKPARRHGAEGYQKTTYRFDNGAEIASSYAGLALKDHLRPTRLVILGTAASMWDVLVEELNPKGEASAERLELMEAVETGAVSDAHLQKLEPLASRLLNMPCQLAVIPAGRDLWEQTDILQIMTTMLGDSTKISLDVTHGYRILPMVALMCALLLERTHEVQVDGIYYGAYEMAQAGVAPIVRLDGFLQIAQWIHAFSTFDKDGDFGVFAPLLEQSGMKGETARELEKAAFYERLFNVADSAKSLHNVLRTLPTSRLDPVAELFRDKLVAKLDWRQAATRFERERRLAYFYLDNRDYARAVIFCYEAFVSSLIKPGEDTYDYDLRERTKKEFFAGAGRDKERRNLFSTLNGLRNSIVHGHKPKHYAIRRLVKNPDTFDNEIRQLFNKLLVPPASAAPLKGMKGGLSKNVPRLRDPEGLAKLRNTHHAQHGREPVNSPENHRSEELAEASSAKNEAVVAAPSQDSPAASSENELRGTHKPWWRRLFG